jgi:hypothetical protein
MEDEEGRRHAILGGSTAHIWTACTGSVALCRDIPKEAPSESALQGTEGHSIAEIVVEDFLEHKISGSDPGIRSHLTAKSPEMLEAAHSYRDAIWINILEQSITGKAYGLEELVTLDKNLEMYGYVDFWTVFKDDHAKKVLAQVDYKYGYYPVEIKKNPQVAFYLVSMRKELQRSGIDIDYARGAIFQPRKPRGDVYTEVRYTAKQLDAWEKKFFTAAEKIFITKKTSLKVGEHCKFCPAKNGVCPAYAKHIANKSSLALIDPKKALKTLPSPETLPDETIRNIILIKNELISWVKGISSYGVSRNKAGSPIPGLKLVEGATRRKWPSEDSHERIGEKLKETGLEDPYKPPQKILKPISQIETELKKLGVKDGKKFLDPYVTRTNPTLTLVSEEDSRPKVKNALDILQESSDDSYPDSDIEL